MPTAAKSYQEDLETVRACMNGEDTVLRELQGRLHKRLLGQLISRGGSETEANDLLADLWAECAVGRPDKAPLFEKYHGKCGLYTWLVTVATHRLVDLKRRQKFHGDLPVNKDDPSASPDFDRLPARAQKSDDVALKALMNRSLQMAILEVPSDAFLLLQLVYLHGVMQREAAKMYGWHESKVSRTLDATMTTIASRTMTEIKAVDPWLELRWEDFVELCANSDVLLGK